MSISYRPKIVVSDHSKKLKSFFQANWPIAGLLLINVESYESTAFKSISPSPLSFRHTTQTVCDTCRHILYTRVHLQVIGCMKSNANVKALRRHFKSDLPRIKWQRFFSLLFFFYRESTPPSLRLDSVTLGNALVLLSRRFLCACL